MTRLHIRTATEEDTALILRFIRAIDVPTMIVSLGTLAVLIVWPRISRTVPAPFVAMIAATAAVQLLSLLVATIGLR